MGNKVCILPPWLGCKYKQEYPYLAFYRASPVCMALVLWSLDLRLGHICFLVAYHFTLK